MINGFSESEILSLITRSINEGNGSHLEVGMVTRHPKDGKIVYITKGEYLDSTYGRLSNFWHWREVLQDGSLSNNEEHGYGWSDPVKIDATIETTTKVIIHAS